MSTPTRAAAVSSVPPLDSLAPVSIAAAWERVADDFVLRREHGVYAARIVARRPPKHKPQVAGERGLQACPIFRRLGRAAASTDRRRFFQSRAAGGRGAAR